MNPPVYFKSNISQVHSDAGCSGTGRYEPPPSTYVNCHAGTTPLNLSNSAYHLQTEIGPCERNETYPRYAEYVDGDDSDTNSTVGEEGEDWAKQETSLEIGNRVGSLPSDCGQCTCDNDSDHESVLKEVVKDQLEELIIEHCLQTHHAFKSGILAVGQQKVEQLDKDEKDMVVWYCPECKGKHKEKDILNRLATCMKLQVRKPSRNSGRSKPANYRVDNDEDYTDDETDSSLKKKKRRRQNGSRSGRVMTQSDKRRSMNPDQLCGIKMKNGKDCSLRKPCSRHFKKSDPNKEDPNKEEKIECFPASFPAESVYFVPDPTDKLLDFKPITNNNSPGIRLTLRTDGMKKPNTKSENYDPSCS